MGVIHSFDTDIATQVGVNGAVIYETIKFWCFKHKVDGTNYYDGNWWVFNSRRAWCESFPYLSDKNIQTALTKLFDAGLILKGNYNTEKFDRTNWYAIADKDSLVSGDSKLVSRLTSSGQCIDQKRSTNTITSTNITSTSIESKKNSACAHTREGVVADIIENNTAWVENQIKAGVEPDDIPALLGYAYDYLLNTGDEPNSKAVVRCAFFRLREFKEHMRRERLRAIPYEERKNELWQQLRQLMPKYGKDLVTRFYAYQIKLKDGLMNAEQSPDFDPDAALTQWKLNDERNNKHTAL